ncbi:hypothetical protein Vafri_4624 [Volvox africanus]|uniref:J domain-containing protein n=1 Tax=Volvox africanus TaxID=51714 RepID=A0A8J4AYV9_9CHLO|nr:hypothetical protein Vafri_4624 [Volvox africanus]
MVAAILHSSIYLSATFLARRCPSPPLSAATSTKIAPRAPSVHFFPNPDTVDIRHELMGLPVCTWTQNKAEEEFMRLKLAYDILSDSATRAQYDMLLTQRKRATTTTRQRTSSVSSERRAASARGSGVSRRGDHPAAASPYRTHSPHPQQQQPGPAPPGADDWMPSSSGRSRSSRTPPPSRPSWYGRPVNRSGGTSVRGTSASRASQQPNTSSPNWGDDWGSWAASTRSNTAAGRSMAVGTAAASPPPPSPPPSGPMSGDDWTSTYARVAVGSPDNRTNPGRDPAAAAAAAATAAASSYDEWGNSDSPLSSGDDLEWYSGVVAAAAGAGSGATKLTTSTSSASATGAGINTPAAAVASTVATSKGDDFDLFSAVAASVVPSAATAAVADGAGSGAAAVPPPPPASPSVPPRPAPPTVVPTGDDFALFASVAAAAPLPAPTRPTPSPPRRRTSTSFMGASSVWENSSSTPALNSVDSSATAAASEAKPATAEELSATAPAPVASAVSCTTFDTLEPVPLQTRPTGQVNETDKASRSDVISLEHVAAESRDQSAATSVASDPTAVALAAAHAAAVAAAAALAAATAPNHKSVRAAAAPATAVQTAAATVAATVAVATAAKATTSAATATATATATANDSTTRNCIVGKDGAEVLSRPDGLGAAAARAVGTVEADPPASPLNTPAVEVPVMEPQVDVAAVDIAADATGRNPPAHVLQAPPPPAADPVQGVAERSEDQRNDVDVMAVADSAGEVVAIVVTPAAEANAHPATATAASPDTLGLAPMAAAVPDSAATEGVQDGKAPPLLAFWKHTGMSYNPDFLAAALAAASVVTAASRFPAAGPGDGVSDSDSVMSPGYANGHVPGAAAAAATSPSDAEHEAQEQQEQPGDDGAGDKAQGTPDNKQEKDLQPAAAPVSGLSFSDALDASEGWRRSYSPIKSAGIYFNEGLGGGAGSIFSPKTPPSAPKNGPGSIFGSSPPPPPPGNRR